MIETDVQRRVGPHRMSNDMSFFNSKRIHDRKHVPAGNVLE
jgi:hypothetical protein